MTPILFRSPGRRRFWAAVGTMYEHNEAQFHRLRRTTFENLRIQAKYFGSTFSIGSLGSVQNSFVYLKWPSLWSSYHHRSNWTFMLKLLSETIRFVDFWEPTKVGHHNSRMTIAGKEAGETQPKSVHKCSLNHLSIRTFLLIGEKDQLFRIWNWN